MQNTASLGLVVVGNALVDVLTRVDDSFIEAQAQDHGMHKGAMTLIDAEQASALYNLMQSKTQSSGGSGANTMAGFSSFGGRGGFIGKVADDALGRVFQTDLQDLGVQYGTPPLTGDEPTGQCLIFVTPDGIRTMNTFLGASTSLTADDIDEALIAGAMITYLEGYLFDKDTAKQAFVQAAQYAKKAGRQVALTLSDPFCVDRHRADFLSLVSGYIDILFANEEEIKSLYQHDDFDAAVQAVSENVDIAVITRGENGSVIRAGDAHHVIAADPVDQVIDTTGAGDQFAAGFLYGLTEGEDLETCGRLGSRAAASVITHMGPRPAVSYADFLEQAA